MSGGGVFIHNNIINNGYAWVFVRQRAHSPFIKNGVNMKLKKPMVNSTVHNNK